MGVAAAQLPIMTEKRLAMMLPVVSEFEMAQPKPTAESVVVPEELRPLVEQLAKLQPSDRDIVVRAAVSQRRSKAVSWELLEAARGVVSFGGDAVEDCKALYDG